MATLTLRNIGPVREVNVVLNLINVFIGPQSSGKSTVAKIISFCNWLEKDCVLEQSVEFVTWEFIQEKLITYHNLQGYILEGSFIRYEGRLINLNIEFGKAEASIVNRLESALLSKNAYIPSERNMLALPGIFTIKMPGTYLLDFIDDWQEIRTKYTSDDKMAILNLGESYFFNDSANKDRILLDNGRDISFAQASSGLQSVVPLCVYIDYLTRWIYEHEENRSAADRKKYRDAVAERASTIFRNFYTDNFGEKEAVALLQQFISLTDKEKQGYLESIIKKLAETEEGEKLPQEAAMVLLSQAIPAMMNLQLKFPISTNLVIEEPEQNLFPKTQVNLVYYIFSKLQHQTRGDSIVVTTHSPYILYALNNCMLAALAIKGDKDNEELVGEYSTVPAGARIDPVSVSVWEIEDGCIKDNRTIQDEQGLIRDNYFDRIMKTVMADFNNLINFIR